MKDNEIILYPSNWLYNAGVIGLLRVLEASESTLRKDGTINCGQLQNGLSDLRRELASPLNNLPNWHWNYVDETFKWNYGSVEQLVNSNLDRASRTTNRKPMSDQLQCKTFNYENDQVDFTKLNDAVKNSFSSAFGKNRTLTVDEAAKRILKNIDNQHAFIYRKAIGFLFSQGAPYKNFFNPSKFKDLKQFIENFTFDSISRKNDTHDRCGFCARMEFKTEPVTSEMMSFLFPVYSAFPNAYWTNNDQSVTRICSLCKFIVLHYHLGFARLSDGTWMFVNAPSFNAMYHLNNLLRTALQSSTDGDSRRIRSLVATSVIELSTRMQATLGVWAGMNIEVITKRGDQVEYFSLPYHVVKLISNRQIATSLGDLGEFRLLNLVLNEEYSKLTEVGYRLLREGISDRRNYDYINDWLYLEKNKRNPSRTANKIFKLYALIEERRRNPYAR